MPGKRLPVKADWLNVGSWLAIMALHIITSLLKAYTSFSMRIFSPLTVVKEQLTLWKYSWRCESTVDNGKDYMVVLGFLVLVKLKVVSVVHGMSWLWCVLFVTSSLCECQASPFAHSLLCIWRVHLNVFALRMSSLAQEQFRWAFLQSAPLGSGGIIATAGQLRL